VEITIPAAEYQRLVEAALAGDDMLIRCEKCGAWLDRDEPGTASVDDFSGCWWSATGRDSDKATCRSYRAP